jgi:hypothetical protein
VGEQSDQPERPVRRRNGATCLARQTDGKIVVAWSNDVAVTLCHPD